MTVPAFDLALPGRVSFGVGRSAEVAQVAAGLGRRVLVVTGGSPGRVAPLVEPIRTTSDALDVVTAPGEPAVEDARRAVSAGRALGADVVVAIGGGSAIDLAKAVAMLLGNGGDPLDYIEVVGAGQPIACPSVPVVAVPTTAGTGAEVTANAVLAVPEHGVKASLRHPSTLPRHAIVDPGLTVACPPAVTAAAGMDALTQCLEPYVSKRANPVTDAWALAGLAAAGQGLRAAFADGSDLTARTRMSLCSLMGGLALANAKLGAVHGFAGVIGGLSGAPHGAICTALLVPVCRANLGRSDANLGARYAAVAQALTGDPDASAQAGLDWIEQTRLLLGVPGLGSYGLLAEHAEEVARGAARASSMQGNPVELSQDELAAIYLAAL